jgi:hypothetical protein
MPSGKTHCAIPLQIDTLKRFPLPKRKQKEKHDSLFRLLFFEISPEHLFPPRQEAEDMSQQRQTSANLHIKKRVTRTKIKNNNNKLHLTGMFSKRNLAPYRSN